MKVHNDGSHWVIAKNFQLLDANGISGSRQPSVNRIREIYDCWTGDRWANQRASAKQFTSEEDATVYLEEHYEKLHTSD